MPVNGNGQFQYPETGWSTGRMRKIGDAISGDVNIGEAAGRLSDNPVVDTIERLTESQKQAQGQYDTQLSPAEETAFQKWKKKFAPNDSGSDYDLRGAYKAGLRPDPDTGHWPDLYKKPNHPTFSDQSIYAKDRPDLAGHWEGNQYIPSGSGKRSELGTMKMAKRTVDTERSMGIAQDWLGEGYSRRGTREIATP